MNLFFIVVVSSVIGGMLCGTIIALSSEVASGSARGFTSNFSPPGEIMEKKFDYKKYGVA